MNKPNETFFEYQKRLLKDPIEQPSLDIDDEEIDDEPLDLSEVPSDGPKSVEDILAEMDDEDAYSTPFSGISISLYAPEASELCDLRVRRTDDADIIELLLTVYAVNPGQESRVVADNYPIRINRDDWVFTPNPDTFPWVSPRNAVASVNEALRFALLDAGLDEERTSIFKFLSDFLPED